MNNKAKRICAVTATATITAITAVVTIKKIRRSRSEKERHKQLREYSDAITDALTDYEVTDFQKFQEYLKEYHGITSECVDGNKIIYSSDRYQSKVSGNDFIDIVPDIYNKRNIELKLTGCYLDDDDNDFIY